MSGKRGTKKNMVPPTQDFFALGANSTVPVSQNKLPTKRPNDPFQTAMTMSPKRARINSPVPQSGVIAGGPSGTSRTTSKSSGGGWEERALVVPPNQLKDKVLEAENCSSCDETVERLLYGAAIQLRDQKVKPDPVLVLSLLYLAKTRPLYFANTNIVQAFASILTKREAPGQFKTKNSTVAQLVINVLHFAYHDETTWPEQFIHIFVEDSLGDRIWVDHEECKGFVDTIITSFRTKLPPKSLLQTSDVSSLSKSHAESSPSFSLAIGEDSMGDDASCSSNPPSSLYSELSSKDSSGQPLTSRYLDNQDNVIAYVTNVISDNLNRQSMLQQRPPNERLSSNDISRNLLKLLTATAGIHAVRFMVAQKLEQWFQNPKLTRPAQDLLLTIFLNCDQNDMDTLTCLLRMRLPKTQKHLASHYYICFKEMLNQKNSTFDIALRTLLNNEIQQVRHQNNYQLISLMFQNNLEQATVVMARFFYTMIFQREDYLRILRYILREVTKSLNKTEPLINNIHFVSTILNEFKNIDFSTLEQSIKEKMLRETIDLITMSFFTSITSTVREAYNVREPRSSIRDSLRNFQMKIATIQFHTIIWLYETVVGRMNLEKEFFSNCLNKLLFLEPLDQYVKLDNYPNESDRIPFYRAVSEVPVYEETIQCILDMGFSKDFPLSTKEACDTCCTLINRAALVYDGDPNFPVLLFQNVTIIEKLFQSTVYSSPENSVFPANYKPPSLAITDYYWKVWLHLVLLVAHKPLVFGDFAWNKLPTFRMLIEMAITNNFHFPPKSPDCEDLQNKMLQYSQAEKIKILEYEGYLAGNREITESNSYLLSTLTTLDPYSVPRRPPKDFLDQFKVLCTANYRLCNLLCQSRRPDFLMIIIEKNQSYPGSQGYLSTLNWLIDLVEGYESNFNVLPVQCLCEYLIRQIAEENFSSTSIQDVTKSEKMKRREKRKKLIRLVAYFQNDMLQGSPDQLGEPLHYLITRLSFAHSMVRALAYKALYLLVSCRPEDLLGKDENTLPPLLPADLEPDWLKTKLLTYLKSEQQNQMVCQAMENALVVESNPLLITEYVDFIASCMSTLPSEDLVIHCAVFLIKRKKISTYIISYSSNSELKNRFLLSLYSIFYLYIQKQLLMGVRAKRPEEIFVRFNNTVIVLSPCVVHGVVLALSYASDLSSRSSEAFKGLTKLFLTDPFPEIFSDPDLRNPEPLIPEWLCLPLLCSQSNEIISFVLSQMKPEFLVSFLNHYGLSSIALQRILQSLDKLNAAESRAIKNLEFDRVKVLSLLKVYWAKGYSHGYKFAKTHLNYKGEIHEIEDVEMVSAESTKKKYDHEIKLESFKREDIVQTIQNNDKQKCRCLTRLIMAELDDTSVKQKKHTKLFLMEFKSCLEEDSESFSILDYILEGSFDSIFNVIFILVMKDSKNFGFKDVLKDIRDLLMEMKLPPKKSIQDISCWKYFDRFFTKESPKSKKVKSQKKKKLVRSASGLEDFIEDFSLPVNAFWSDIYKDLAIEKFYKKDTELEDLNVPLRSVIFTRNRPYFLSLLLHKSNFTTLKLCIKHILGKESLESPLNPTAVLDFLTICINSPKLWLGLESESQRVFKHEDVLRLEQYQIERLIDYVIEENDIPNRLELIFKSCCIGTQNTEFVVEMLKKSGGEKDKLWSELYTRLYLHLPSVDLPLKCSDEHFELIQTSPSFLDKITHNLFTSILFIESGSAPISPQLMAQWELALLKMASKHPLLFMRQLPLIPSMLSGKINVQWEVFKGLNVLNIFRKLLNMLHLLKPHIWKKYAKGVFEILNLYMEMFMNYYQLPRQKDSNEQLLPIMVQFLTLIDDWVKHEPESANSWIKYHKHAFGELSLAYYNEQHLFKAILSGLPLPRDNVVANPLATSRMYVARLRITNGDSVVTILNEVNKLSDKQPQVAVHLLDEIRSFYTEGSTCELALSISHKALQYNPSLAHSIVSSYVKCIESDSCFASNTALNFLSEFVLLAQDYRYLILRKVFELAIAGNTKAMPALLDSFRCLNSQTGA